MLILERPLTRQPPAPIARRDGFLRDAKLLWLASAPILDWSARNNLSWALLNYSLTTTVLGPAYSNTITDGQYIGLPTNDVIADVSKPFTLVWIGRRNANSSAGYDTVFSNRGTSSANANGAAINIWGAADANQNKPYFEIFSSAGVQYYTTIQSQVALSSTQFSVLVGVWDGSNVIMYQNGVAVSTSAAAATLTTRTDAWRIGSRIGVGNPGMIQTVVMAGALNGARSAAEIAAFSRSPLEFLKHLAPRRIYIPTSTAATTAPSITSLSARLITATSAQPRISYS